jgi:beta-lactamase class C
MLAVAFLYFGASACAANSNDQSGLESIVNGVIQSVMNEHDVPGMAVAITARGERHFFNYGVASKDHGRKVDEHTIFEIGSISKTFAATLAAYAEASGALSLSDKASKHWPALAGSHLDDISLLDLGTYVAGGLPLQFPDDVTDQEKMIDYYREWQSVYAIGTHRQYSNPSIGLFGHLAARSMDASYDALMEEKLFPMLGLTQTYFTVPKEKQDDYAYGYSKDNRPTRVSPGVLDSEAYGVKTTAADMIKYVEANMGRAGLDARLRHAIAATHTGYYKVGSMTQGLGWEMYDYPTDLDTLLFGNSAQLSFQANEVSRPDSPLSPTADVLINKTGSTIGFGAYVMFIPAKNIGIVMLANKNYPNVARVKAAYKILTALQTE